MGHVKNEIYLPTGQQDFSFFSALHSAILQNPKSVSGAILNFTITERFFARCLVESYV